MPPLLLALGKYSLLLLPLSEDVMRSKACLGSYRRSKTRSGVRAIPSVVRAWRSLWISILVGEGGGREDAGGMNAGRELACAW